MLVDRAQRLRHRPRGRHADAQLAARRLLPASRNAPTSSASTASATRSGRSSAPFVGGLLAYWFGWRAPFFVFVVPTLVFVILGLRLKEPGRGHYEREAAGASAEAIATDEVPPSFAESVRILWQVRTLRRIWYSLPFLAASFIGLVTLTSLYYEQVFHLDDAPRGFVAAATEPAADRRRSCSGSRSRRG